MNQIPQTAQKPHGEAKRRELSRFQATCELQKFEFIRLRKLGYVTEPTEFQVRTEWIRDCGCLVCAEKRMASAYWYSWLPGGHT